MYDFWLFFYDIFCCGIMFGYLCVFVEYGGDLIEWCEVKFDDFVFECF